MFKINLAIQIQLFVIDAIKKNFINQKLSQHILVQGKYIKILNTGIYIKLITKKLYIYIKHCNDEIKYLIKFLAD